MNVVIDAQIINWYLSEITGGHPPATHSPAALIDALGGSDVAWLDEGGMIEHEWRSTSDPEWFDQWYADLLARGGALILPVSAARSVLQRLHKDFGFPRSRDVWYISTACSVRDATRRPSVILSEDLDFFDPPLKASAKARQRNDVL